MGITPKELQEAEQAMALVSDTMPPMWYRMFDNLRQEGFTEDQALSLVKTYIKTSLGPREGEQ